ncbi:MAG: cytochrome c3 family protein [Ignavibacteriae bacterium]|nr:cytochrome c3 family protein [Ignavibacteriota bacterium]MCB9244216.1 cytochrome c3 family protein [Ignavibacteriales bacterium]
MGEEKKIKEKRFFKKVRGFKRFLLFTGIYILSFVILVGISAEYTSRPSFCPTCHYMETFHQSWKVSAHNKVECVECHFEPGMAGTIKGKLNGLVQIVNYVSLAYKKRKPWAEISDNTCARSGCHNMDAMRDSLYEFHGVEFSHRKHLEKMADGKSLKCTSCHSQVEQNVHMEVITATCASCHFKKSSNPDHDFAKLSDCKLCHHLDQKTPEQLADMRYNHTMVVNNKVECAGCHTNVTSGDGDVGKERCLQCHFENEKLEKLPDTKLVHEKHIHERSIKCYSCHNSIEHKIQKLTPESSLDCQTCHANSHTSQVNLFTGRNGFNVKDFPSTMYLNGINCKGCHIFHQVDSKGIETSKSKGEACETCHGKGYSKLVDQWKVIAQKRLGEINSIYSRASQIVKSSKSDKKAEAEKLLEEANHNIKIVEVGKSVHNIEFSDKLLGGAYDLMKKAVTTVGYSSGLPSFISSSEFVPNECYKCHSGVQEISVNKFGMKFSHNQHIVKERIACDRCHSNANKHGELIVSKQSCNNCHHANKTEDNQCASCHNFQVAMYDGKWMGKDKPDIMKEGGAKCIDCHIQKDKIIKPDDKVCLKCHDAGYDELMVEWKGDVKKLESDIVDLLNKLDKTDLSPEERDQLNEAKKIVNQLKGYPSIYIHNYELISSVLMEKKKLLSKME